MPIDPQIRTLLDLRAALPPFHTLSVPEARAQFSARAVPGMRSDPVASVVNRDMQGPGGSLGLRIYTPKADASPGKSFPLMVYFHGSGFVVCSLDTHDLMCRNLCAGTGCVVVSVDYRLAPEHPFPAAVDDCFAATVWAQANASALGADPSRVLVAGDSAGANLAAVTALRIRDEGGPALLAQLLIYPVTDHWTAGFPSMQENAEGYGLGKQGMMWFWNHYLTDQAEAVHPHVSPLRAKDLARLPPALVLTAEYDPLRDEGEAYAEKLRAAGVKVQMKRYDGMNHGFFNLAGLVNKADTAVDEACAWIRGVV
jgi:acetyl esterase